MYFESIIDSERNEGCICYTMILCGFFFLYLYQQLFYQITAPILKSSTLYASILDVVGVLEGGYYLILVVVILIMGIDFEKPGACNLRQ